MVDECSGSSVNARRRITAAQKKRSARSMVTRQRSGWICSFRSRGLVQNGVIENLTLIPGDTERECKAPAQYHGDRNLFCCIFNIRNFVGRIINTWRTGDADLRFYITTVQDG